MKLVTTHFSPACFLRHKRKIYSNLHTNNYVFNVNDSVNQNNHRHFSLLGNDSLYVGII
jgi:hypothetical protein